jgi:hypothetical protein
MRALRHHDAKASPRMQREVLEIYSVFGIGVNRGLLSDADAVGALRLLVPAYDGPDMRNSTAATAPAIISVRNTA